MFVTGELLYQSGPKQNQIYMFKIMSDASNLFLIASWAKLPVVVRNKA